MRGCPRIAANLTIANRPIENVEVYKFLGLHFDNKLNWKYHIDQVRTKYNKRLNILKNFSHYKWGAEQQILLRIFIMMIKPITDYGIEAVISASENIIKSINTIQNHALRITTGAFKSSLIISLHAITGIKPPEYYREIKLISYYLRLLINTTHPLHLEATECENDENTQYTDKSFFNFIKQIKEKYSLSFNPIAKETPSDNAPWDLEKNLCLQGTSREKKKISGRSAS